MFIYFSYYKIIYARAKDKLRQILRSRKLKAERGGTKKEFLLEVRLCVGGPLPMWNYAACERRKGCWYCLFWWRMLVSSHSSIIYEHIFFFFWVRFDVNYFLTQTCLRAIICGTLSPSCPINTHSHDLWARAIVSHYRIIIARWSRNALIFYYVIMAFL